MKTFALPILFLTFLCMATPQVGHGQTLLTLANFVGPNGANPLFAPLAQGTDGNLYGTTQAGGAHQQGTVFKVTPAGTLTTLYSFCGQSCGDGSAPFAGLLLGKDGNFYGTTELGGTNNEGTIFKITPQGILSTLHSFTIQEGSNPYAGLVQATDGNFYGTTQSGGAHLLGTVFKITPRGALTTLHNFDDTEGKGIVAGLVQASDGNFYGAAGQGGANGYGSVFMMTPVGVLTVLHSFNVTDGATPTALVLGTDGNFYGATVSGGASIDGTVFEITPQGIFTKLHDFNGSDGADPFGRLEQATDGNFDGTTDAGGTNRDGTAFSLGVGLGPFVKTVPTAGKVGASVRILGTNLTGATSVTFNGIAATFVVLGPSQIITKLPAGATTGPVQVTTPTVTLISNVAFQVIQ